MRRLALVLILLPACAAALAQVLQPGAPDPLRPTLYDRAMQLELSGDALGAVKLYAQAARDGDGKAAYRLGEIYEKGLGAVPADLAQARKWFNAARVLGHPPPVGDFPPPTR